METLPAEVYEDLLVILSERGELEVSTQCSLFFVVFSVCDVDSFRRRFEIPYVGAFAGLFKAVALLSLSLLALQPHRSTYKYASL